jgi:hypothetical protein
LKELINKKAKHHYNDETIYSYNLSLYDNGILTEKITIFESINEASKKLKISWNMISEALKQKEYKNLIWQKI